MKSFVFIKLERLCDIALQVYRKQSFLSIEYMVRYIVNDDYYYYSKTNKRILLWLFEEREILCI